MKLILALAVFAPGFAMLGAFSTLDSRLPLWWGLTIGALVGFLFGMVFGHYRAQWLNYLFGQREREEDKGDCRHLFWREPRYIRVGFRALIGRGARVGRYLANDSAGDQALVFSLALKKGFK
jgi:hypothetical protein